MFIMYKFLIRPLLFLLPAEEAHEFTLFMTRFCKGPFKWISEKLFHFEDERLEQEIFGMHFKNPVGLAAGLDKYARALHFWPVLGVGHIEVGGVTPKAQNGNPKPRVFRLKKDRSIINRFGLNNDGVDALYKSLIGRPKSLPIGVNISKNEWTSNEKALEDYLTCLDRLHNSVDFVVVNVSCPNSTNVDQLQEKNYLLELLQALKNRRKELGSKIPLLVKIGPDVENDQLKGMVDVINQVGIDGIIASNTSSNRTDLQTSKEKIQSIGCGGLSGQAITELSSNVIRELARLTQGKVAIIGVGGIANAEQAYEKIRAGASLVQLYTGMVYEGPGLIKKINKGLIELLERDGFESISQAIGADL